MNEVSPAEGRSFIRPVGGIQLHYLDFGATAASGDEVESLPGEDGRPTLLCLHGGAAHSHWFDFVVGALTPTYRVLSLDLRGHGDSDWAPDGTYTYESYAGDVAGFIESLETGPVTLMGHSMGGMVALVTSALSPRHVSRLVVIDSMMQMTVERAGRLRGIGEGKGRSFPDREAYVAGFKIRPDGSTAPLEVVRHMAMHACRQFEDGQWRNKFDRKVYARRHPIDGYEYWPRIKAPTLLVAGANSNRLDPDVLARIRSLGVDASLVVVPEAGHHVTLDNAPGTRAVLSEHLAR